PELRTSDFEPDIGSCAPLADLTVASDFLEPEREPKPLDMAGLFGVPAPLEVEVGCGNGRFLRRAAAERPGHLFLGIERSLSYARKARDRMVKYGVGNVRIFRADATAFLAEWFPEGSIHTLHVYFTDPWPKTKHAKRRIFQPPFLETIHRVVRPGGQVFVKVDLPWYFGEILGRFDRSTRFDVIANCAETDPDRDLYDITGFEQKALIKKGVVYSLVAVNRPNQD
ncbi:tRNA (guanosine(46)-N7)-methyltransferase TrmB, partial [bacterium]|nr:tRNA (guanosine(46)-N7)-methyltransferase TrmB [bacterium]